MWNAKSLNIRVHGIPKLEDPLKLVNNLIQETLRLIDIKQEKAWVFLDSTLVIPFKNVKECIIALWAKQKIFNLLNKIYLDEDLKWIQVDELKKAKE